MRVLLTGATGLIGSAVANRLRAGGELYTLGRQAGQGDVTADLTNPEQVSALRLPRIDCLVHCAGVIDEDFKSAPDAAYKRATFGAEALLKSASKAGSRKFIYVSSTHVYGAQVGTKSEDALANPQSHYALAHFCTEQLFRRQAANEQGIAVILRPNAVYGLPPHPESFQRWSLIPFSFPREAVKERTITLKSSGLQKRNFVSVDAVADMVVRCVTGDLTAASGSINVLGSETESVYEFARRCKTIAEEELHISCVVRRPPELLTTADAAVGADFSLVSRYTQLRPAGELDDFIRKFIRSC